MHKSCSFKTTATTLNYKVRLRFSSNCIYEYIVTRSGHMYQTLCEYIHDNVSECDGLLTTYF